MKTVVRFGGITAPEPLAAIPDGGAAGFLFELPGAPRSLTGEQIVALLEKLPNGVEAWAQVQDPSAETIHRLFDEVGVDRIEVHGPVPSGLEFLEIHHLIPALAMPGPGTDGPMPSVPSADDYPRLVLDASSRPLSDGHLQRANWELCQQVVDGQPGRKLTLSGGITPENVAEAIQTVRPWGIGVCAAVETAPGNMDPARMRTFLEAVAAGEV